MVSEMRTETESYTGNNLQVRKVDPVPALQVAAS